MTLINLSPAAIEAAGDSPGHEIELAAAILADAITGYWQAVLTYESMRGVTADQARAALDHSALALRALKSPVGVAS